MVDKAPSIGLRQAQRLCRMQQAERLAFIADGLPVVLASAQGFWRAASRLDGQVREAVVLEHHAEEQAAKVLILMDMVRSEVPTDQALFNSRRCGAMRSFCASLTS